MRVSRRKWEAGAGLRTHALEIIIFYFLVLAPPLEQEANLSQLALFRGCPVSDGSNSKTPSFDGKTPFEAAAEVVERYKGWINWDDAKEVIGKPVASAVALLTVFKLQELVPDLFEHLSACIEDGNFVHDYANFYEHYTELRSAAIRDLSKFITQSYIEKEVIRQGQQKYYATQVVICLVDFLLTHKPCCRLVQTAWLIPAIASGIPAIPLVAYAAEQLADFINDPIERSQLDCTPVGNSWLHRLGIYLLHQCNAQSIPPDPRLIRLMSLVSLPPSSSVKSGKATRCSHYLAYAESPHYLHEAPPACAMGTALALELLGEFDANRQGEYFRRIERAAAFYGHSCLNGVKPSIKSVQRVSGLSWSDANKLVSRPFFSRLAFEYQCRYLIVEPCNACEAIGRALDAQSDQSTAAVQSSGSSW
jgi:hypothetical protein